ncbi:MAG: RsmD family RNA methyltransferase, partial [Chloroflexi bacterium]|nr:RsmD family RNA methyltransferase [Chloroflexota bacterium]
MRVISGSARGRELKGPKAAKGNIRPTSDKV